MKPEPRCFALRVFPVLCLLLLASPAAAQNPGNYCEASSAVKAEIKKVINIVHEKAPFMTLRDRQLATMRELLNKYPGDFHLQRRYQDVQRSGLLVDTKPLLAGYRERMEKDPRDPVAIYLYSRMLI